VGSGGNFAKLVNLFEIGRFVEEVWEVCGFGLGDLGGVVVCDFEGDGLLLHNLLHFGF
jgi:hypothetical protein